MTSDPADGNDQPLRSVFTAGLPDIFRQLNISLAVSTYQAGKVILVRRDDAGDANGEGVINTHFRNFDKPMGIAVRGNRLTIGGARTVWEYRNMPAVAARLDPPGKYDACYLPRSIHITGDIDIHEMAWDDDDQLWLVNTRFCCLCTLDVDHSFHPRWRPHFVSALAPEDRCHLNGLAMVDGRPRYVTALGETDTQGGWRANKASGGILMDVADNNVLLRGLSMPHSPRWYRGQLWLLESGKGTLSRVDLKYGTCEAVARLPGFTRGIDFVGPLAFIGLSQVRESAVFSGIPIVKELTERTCGVWVVHIESGQTLGFLRFESGVQEIFAVQVLHHTHFPEMLEWSDPHIGNSYVLPDAALAEVAMPSEEELANRPSTLMRQGVQQFHKGEFAQAVASFRACLARQADFPEATFSLGVALAETGELDEALGCLLNAVDKEPDRADIQQSLGSLYCRLRRPDAAIAAYEKALEREPDNAMTHHSLGVALLRRGDYTRGFKEYAWLLKTGQVPTLRSPHPVWDGAAVPDKTLLVRADGLDPEQVLLLARYLPKVAERCGKLLLSCDDPLAALLSIVPGIADIRRPDQIRVTDFDVQTSLISLPLLWHTTPESVPASIPCFDVNRLRKRGEAHDWKLPGTASQRRIGLVRSPGRAQDSNAHLACPVAALEPLLEVNDAVFVSLHLHADAERNAAFPDTHVHDAGDALTGLAALALLIDQLDLVIGVDSAAVHLAGALGKPAWVLLGDLPAWYWPSDSQTTPWYPGMRVFHQPSPDDWQGVIARAAHALADTERD